jgi:Fe-S cluster biosynthesis and repair protein YggX
MSYIKELKEDVRDGLEKNFIDNSGAVKKEMELLNILITSFVDDKYTYDEYCRCRMQFEVEGCDEVDIDFEEENILSNQEKDIIKSRAVRKHMDNKETTIYEELLKEEWVKWQVEKSVLIDQKVFFPIIRHASIQLLKNKIKGEVWSKNEFYFVDICDSKSKDLAAIIANNNKEKHEDHIRSSNM